MIHVGGHTKEESRGPMGPAARLTTMYYRYMTDHSELLASLRRHNLLAPLIQRKLIAEAVENELVTNEEVTQARINFLRDNNLKDDDELEEHLAKNGLNNDIFEWQISLPIKIKKHCEKNYSHKAEAYFLSKKNQLDIVTYSLLRVRDSGLAQELYWRIDANEANFGDLASTYSEGAERNTKGIVGPVPLTQAHPILAEALRITQPGKLIDPIQIGEWWIVSRLENYKSANYDEAMARRLSHEIFDKAINAEVARRIELSDDPLGVHNS